MVKVRGNDWINEQLTEWRNGPVYQDALLEQSNWQIHNASLTCQEDLTLEL